MSSVALTLSALFLIFCGYFGHTKFTALLLLSIGVGAGGLQIAGHPVGIIDMAPRFAGVIMGFMNCAGTIPGIIGPIIAKNIANAVSIDREQSYNQLLTNILQNTIVGVF